MRARPVTLLPLTAALLVASAPAASAQIADQCNFRDVPGAVWWGTSSQMTMVQLASHVAPVYWFSPDEPLLRGAVAGEIMLPQALPFEPAPDGPVVYYQVEELVYASPELLAERNAAAGELPLTREP